MRYIWLLSVFVASALTGVAILLSMGVPGSAFGDETPASESEPLPPRDVVTVVIQPGDSAAGIADALEEQGVIRSSRQFEVLAALLGFQDQLKAGAYDFEPGINTMEVLRRLRDGVTSPLVVTVPEGKRLEEVADILAEHNVVSRADFLAAARNPDNWRGTLAAERPLGTSLDGYLFPATYAFSLRATADDVVRQFLERLDQEFPLERRQDLVRSGATVHGVLTLASIVEREAVEKTERGVIASVFVNRLAQNMRLQADPTVQYSLAQIPGNVERFGYWKEALTLDDLRVPSAYNTYFRVGLPLGPIANPGAAAIDAAIQPAATTFLFFVARGDGSHVFATTFEEHLRNVEVFQGVILEPADEGESEEAE